MIANDLELQTTQERIAYFQGLLARMRVAAKPEDFLLMAGGYQAEIEKMQREAMDYLMRHVSQMPAAMAG